MKIVQNIVISFQMLGQTNILTCLSSAYADEIKIHNGKVKKQTRAFENNRHFKVLWKLQSSASRPNNLIIVIRII